MNKCSCFQKNRFQLFLHGQLWTAVVCIRVQKTIASNGSRGRARDAPPPRAGKKKNPAAQLAAQRAALQPGSVLLRQQATEYRPGWQAWLCVSHSLWVSDGNHVFLQNFQCGLWRSLFCLFETHVAAMRKRKPDKPSMFTAFGLSSKRSRAGETVPEPTESQAVAGSSASHDRSSELSPVDSQCSTVESSTVRRSIQTRLACPWGSGGEVHLVRKTLKGIWSEAVKDFEPVYADMLKMATEAGRPELSVPRTCQRQTQRSGNVPAETPKDYWRRSVFLPFRDHLLTELNCRFPAMTKAAVEGLRLLPENWGEDNGCRTGARWLAIASADRPMESICQRRNTSTRSFGFGRPSGAASRLKVPSTVPDKSLYFRMFCKSWSCCWSPRWQPRRWSVLTRPWDSSSQTTAARYLRGAWLHCCACMSTRTLYQKLLEIEKEIVGEVALRGEHHLRKSADRKAQISSVSGTNAFLICAFRSADF